MYIVMYNDVSTSYIATGYSNNPCYSVPRQYTNGGCLLFHSYMYVNCFSVFLVYMYTYMCVRSADRALCLECRVSWVRIPPEAAHFSLKK